ncbi:MAG: hypothetical protein C0469_14055 [Cyanobacteria bacterium DS2.3.42]|nr:hypothetical protein [Cyanobacteria bacterium DS2.3.42]
MAKKTQIKRRAKQQQMDFAVTAGSAVFFLTFHICWNSQFHSRSLKKMFRIVGVLALLAGVAWGIFYLWTSTPEYSISQVKDAVKAHDKAKFDKFVDTEEFADGMVDDMLTKPIKEAMGGNTIGRWVAAGMSGIFKPQFVSQIKKDLYDLVEKGSISQSVGTDVVDPDMTLGAVDRRLCLSQNDFKKIENIKSDGKVATVTVVLHNKEHNKDFKLDVQMQKTEGYWRVTKMLNFPEFVARLIEVESVHQNEQTRTTEPIRRI